MLELIPHTPRRKMTKAEITAEFVRGLLDYDATTGILTWRVRRAGLAKKGSRAGCGTHWNGYRTLTLGNVQCQEHAVAWLHHYGTWPSEDLDHVNGDRADNRIANLRECSPAQNAQNLPVNRDNKSGFLGVYRPKKKNKWRAQIKKDGVRHYLGDYFTPEEAHQAYLKAKAELHEFNPVPRKGVANG